MIVAEIIERLGASCSPPLALIKGVADLAALDAAQGGPPATPAAYVWIAEEASAENSRANGVLQRTEMDVAILIVTRNVADAAGGSAADEIETIKAQIRARLIGWTPASAIEELTAVGGRLVSIRNGYVRYEIVLSAVVYLEA